MHIKMPVELGGMPYTLETNEQNLYIFFSRILALYTEIS